MKMIVVNILQGVILLVPSKFETRSTGTVGIRRRVTALVLAGTLAAAGAALSACTPNGTSPDDSVGVHSTAVATDVLTDDGRIHENIWINNVDVGGLTVDEAKIVLAASWQNTFDASTIAFTLDSAEVQNYSFNDFDIRLDFDSALQEAYNYTRTGGAVKQTQNAESLITTPLDLEAGCFFDTTALSDVLVTLSKAVTLEAVEPKVQRENGAFILVDGQDGTQLNTEKTLDAFTTALKAYRGEGGRMEIGLVVETVQPQFTSANLSTSMSLLGSWTTSYSGSSENRATNLRVSSGSIHNTYMLPGDVFSTNATFGPTTAANGYKPGGTYVNGKVVDSYGGGVCQTSSTLYRALLEAELQIVERQNHSLPVAYMPMGFDATLAGDYIDMKFKNNLDAPILIEAVMGGGSLTVNIYGPETRDPARSIEYKSTCVATHTPPPEKLTEDPTLPLGERVVDSPAKTGFEYHVHKHIYMNGKLTDTVLVNKSRYQTVAAEVRVGTGPAAPTEAPVVTPMPTSIPASEPSEPIAEATPWPTPEITPTPAPTTTPDIPSATEPEFETPTDSLPDEPLMP